MKVRAKLNTGVNGDGLYFPYTSVYFFGCDKIPKCPNCQNIEMQNYNSKVALSWDYDLEDVIKDIFKILDFDLQLNNIVSLCFVGGEPLFNANRGLMLEISKRAKEKYGNQVCTIMYTWRTLKDIEKQKLQQYIKYIDIGVLGEFMQNKYIENMIPASKNQRIYNFTSQKKLGKIKRRGVTPKIPRALQIQGKPIN